MTSNEPAPDQSSGLPSYGSTPAGDGGSTPPPPPGAPSGGGPAGAKTNPLAIVSLVLGIVSLVLGLCCGFIALLGIGSIITGVISRKQIATSAGAQKGNGMALAGIILGVVAIVLLVVYVILLATGVIDINFRNDFDN